MYLRRPAGIPAPNTAVVPGNCQPAPLGGKLRPGHFNRVKKEGEKVQVAIKVIDRNKIKEDYVRENLYREARILAQLRHPNVVRLYEAISSSSLYCLVTEYAGGGDLLSFVRGQREGRLTEAVARPFVRQLVSALHHLHERGVVHRDLKMENIMLDEERKNLKIVDFGLSNTFSPDCLLKTHCGSPEYAAPELFITDQEYGPEVDIWSLGINMFAMVTGRLPFSTPYSENRRQRLMQQIQNGLGVIHGREMAHLSDDCQELMCQLIEPSPELRLPLLDIEIHPWITSLGKMPFCPYQQPPKDNEVKRLIIDRMACLLNVSAAKIEANVHEYRLDDVSAIYNLMLDQHRQSKGFWDVDHTLKREVKRPKPVEVVVPKPNTPPPPQGPPGEENPVEHIKLKTPTVIGMVRPSQQNPDRRTCLSADFELSAVSTDERPRQNRAKTATFPQTGTKTRPFGNATTANSLMARYYNFGPPSSAQQSKVNSSPASSPANNAVLRSCGCNDKPMKSKTRQRYGNGQPPRNLKSASRDKDVQCDLATNHQPHSEGDGPAPGSSCSQQHTKQLGRKINVDLGETLLSTDEQVSQIKTNAEGAHDVKVIDMAKYFNYKHGYIIKETIISDGNSVNGQDPSEDESEGHHRPSVTLCSANQDQIISETSRQDMHSAESSRTSSPAKTAAQRNELLRQQMRMPTRPVNAHFCPHMANPSLQKTLLLTKRAWHARHPQQLKRSSRNPKENSGQGPVAQFSHSVSRSDSNSLRARLCTPIATLQSMEGGGHQCPARAQAQQGEDTRSSGTPKGGVRRNAMPQRLDWKRSSSGKSRAWTEDRGAAVRESAEMARGINTMQKLQEMMSRDNVHQTLPSGNIRVKSAKIGTPRCTERCQSLQRKSIQSGANGRRVPSSEMHKSCTVQAYKDQYIMDRHKGQHQRSHTHPLSSHDRVVDLNQQHMFSLLQEASTKFEDSLKAEKKKQQSQAVGAVVQANRTKGNKPSQTPAHPNRTKDIQQQQQQQNVRGEGPPRGHDQNDKGTVALQLGQRVQLVRGSLAINSTPPPVLPSGMAPEHVFNVQASRGNREQPVTNESIENKQLSHRGWDAGYRLERKVSDTIKRAGSAVGKTPDLLLNCT
ncbi:uncharacterized protein LOC110978304 isoform X2 [Acanthaster planci]|uniref:Uncharacterized protein LOC110978304 isoform X2 n=1 Tax=Acanthaster planci TaxID=133434 RepID=A0A8B7Y8N0_ACAPL|nr:uncharacterized protein LOC110978304 isoform X2 [Acanthaster planci]